MRWFGAQQSDRGVTRGGRPPSRSISLNTLTLNVRSEKVYTRHGVPISVTGIAQVSPVPPGIPRYPALPLLIHPAVGPAWRCGGAALKRAMSLSGVHWDAA